MIRYDYEADWRPYVSPDSDIRFATSEEIQQAYPPIDLSQPLCAGGMPVWTNGQIACLNSRDEMTIGIGFTGSGKSRRGVAPTAAFLAKAGENIILIDVKGELSTGSLSRYVRGALDENGYKTVFFDLRGFNGDGYNPLLLPYRLYVQNNIGESMRMLHELYSGLAKEELESNSDPFWALEAILCLVAFTVALFACVHNENQIHMLSLAMLLNDSGCDALNSVKDGLHLPDTALSALNSILSMSQKTKMSVVATAYSLIQPFVVNEKLLRMTSCTTFSIEEMLHRKCAIFIIVPDEVSSYDTFVGILISQICASLVQLAYQHGGRLPIRTNFLCDEFTQYNIQNMGRNISAHRSRNIRWYIWCQGLEQLKLAYPKDAPIILENCANLYFMNSPELSLLKYLSERSGYITDFTGAQRPLLRVEDLQTLQKTDIYTETYISMPGKQFVTRLLDVSQYPCLQYPNQTYSIPCHLPQNPVQTLTISSLLRNALHSIHSEKYFE